MRNFFYVNALYVHVYVCTHMCMSISLNYSVYVVNITHCFYSEHGLTVEDVYRDWLDCPGLPEVIIKLLTSISFE